MDHITRTGMSHAQAAQLFGVTPSRISDLMRQDQLVCPRRAGEHGDSRGLTHRNARTGSRRKPFEKTR